MTRINYINLLGSLHNAVSFEEYVIGTLSSAELIAHGYDACADAQSEEWFGSLAAQFEEFARCE